MPVILQNIIHPIHKADSSAKGKLLNIESLKIDDGEFVGIIDAGEGGSADVGKMICGLLRPEFGELSLTGSDGKKPVVSAYFDCECEKSFSETSVEKEITRRVKRIKGKNDEMPDVKAALELVDIDYDSIKNSSPFELSVGDRRRIALAAALAVCPDILVLNDPLKDMDALWCGALMKLLEKINREGTSVILLSSDTSRLAENADRIIIIKNGSIVIDSSAKTVFSEYYGLVHLGIPVPEVRKCCQMLRERGTDIPNNIILYDQFIDRLKILMWRKNK